MTEEKRKDLQIMRLNIAFKELKRQKEDHEERHADTLARLTMEIDKLKHEIEELKDGRKG